MLILWEHPENIRTVIFPIFARPLHLVILCERFLDRAEFRYSDRMTCSCTIIIIIMISRYSSLSSHVTPLHIFFVNGIDLFFLLLIISLLLDYPHCVSEIRNSSLSVFYLLAFFNCQRHLCFMLMFYFIDKFMISFCKFRLLFVTIASNLNG